MGNDVECSNYPDRSNDCFTDEFFNLEKLEAELEMCFVRKVKTYCDTKQTQSDAVAVASVAAANQRDHPDIRKFHMEAQYCSSRTSTFARKYHFPSLYVL